jgi:hypothetical protein
LIVQVPAVTNERRPPDVMVQTPVVLELNVGVRLEVATAVKFGVVPKFWAPGLLKVIVCGDVAIGVTEFEEDEFGPVP